MNPYVVQQIEDIVYEQSAILGDKFPFMKIVEFSEHCVLDKSGTALESEKTLAGARAWHPTFHRKPSRFATEYFEFAVTQRGNNSEVYVGWSSPYTDLLDLKSTGVYIQLKQQGTTKEQGKEPEKEKGKDKESAAKTSDNTEEEDMEISGDKNTYSKYKAEVKRKDEEDKRAFAKPQDIEFNKGDVVGCTLTEKSIRFSKNGVRCATFDKPPADPYLLPHFMLKECKLIANFGATPLLHYSTYIGIPTKATNKLKALHTGLLELKSRLKEENELF